MNMFSIQVSSIAEKQENNRHKQKNNTKHESINDWIDCYFTDNKKAGYVAITHDFKRHKYYGLHDKDKVKKATAGKESQYISINAFDVDFNNKDFSRKESNLKQIRNIAIDIDQYKLGLGIAETLEILQDLIKRDIIPNPNMVLVSRGIQLFYSIDKGASPSMDWLARLITYQFILKLKDIGADSNASDLSRVMRVPNSINERNKATVQPFIWHRKAYTLQELQSYCKSLDEFKTRKLKQRKAELNYNARLLLFYKTNNARLRDLEQLIELRKGNFTYLRNTLLYIYSYHLALLMNTQKDLLFTVRNAFKHVYSEKDKPMTKKEFETTVISAYKDAEQFFNHFKDNGYRVIYKNNDGIIKPYTTNNLIEKLDITEDEQKHLRTIRNEEIARLQDRERKQAERRKQGMETMQEYNDSRKQRKHELMLKAKQLKKEGKSYTKIAEILNISRSYAIRLVKNN